MRPIPYSGGVNDVIRYREKKGKCSKECYLPYIQGKNWPFLYNNLPSNSISPEFLRSAIKSR